MVPLFTCHTAVTTDRFSHNNATLVCYHQLANRPYISTVLTHITATVVILDYQSHPKILTVLLLIGRCPSLYPLKLGWVVVPFEL